MNQSDLLLILGRIEKMERYADTLERSGAELRQELFDLQRRIYRAAKSHTMEGENDD